MISVILRLKPEEKNLHQSKTTTKILYEVLRRSTKLHKKIAIKVFFESTCVVLIFCINWLLVKRVIQKTSFLNFF